MSDLEYAGYLATDGVHIVIKNHSYDFTPNPKILNAAPANICWVGADAPINFIYMYGYWGTYPPGIHDVGITNIGTNEGSRGGVGPYPYGIPIPYPGQSVTVVLPYERYENDSVYQYINGYGWRILPGGTSAVEPGYPGDVSTAKLTAQYTNSARNNLTKQPTDNLPININWTIPPAYGNGAIFAGNATVNGQNLTAQDQMQVPLNATIAIDPYWVNNSLDMIYAGHLTASVKDPNGNVTNLSVVSGQDQTPPKNGTTGAWVQFSPFTGNKAGTWVVTATLALQGTQLAQLSWSIVVLDVPKAAINTCYIVGSPNTPITNMLPITYQKPISVSTSWINNTINLPYTGVMTLTVVKPNGTMIMPTAISGGSQTLTPLQSSMGVNFPPWVPDLYGTYKLIFTLTTGNTTVTSITWAVVVSPPSAALSIGGWSTNGQTWQAASNGMNVNQFVPIYLMMLWQNNSQALFTGHMVMVITKPDGSTVTPSPIFGQDQTPAILSNQQVAFGPITPDQAGTYKVNVTLLVGSYTVTNWAWSFVVVSQASGTVMAGTIYDGNQTRNAVDKMLFYTAYNAPIYLTPQWINNSANNTFKGHLAATVTYPDGSVLTLSATGGQDVMLNPLNIQGVNFAPFPARSGTYVVGVVLTTGSQVLASMTWALNIVIASIQITDRIAAAKAWIDSLFQSDGTYGYIKEYPGLPLAEYVYETNDLRLLGNWKSSPINAPLLTGYSNITNPIILPGDDNAYIGFDDTVPSATKLTPTYLEPQLYVYRHYRMNSQVIALQVQQDDATYHSGIYLANNAVLSNLNKNNANQNNQVILPYSPANRYTIRHGAALGKWLYSIWGDSKSGQLAKLRSDYGFTYDIYDPLFGQSAGEADDFMFTLQAYHDTLDVLATLPQGMNPNRYPYYSKLQLGGILSLGVYITQTKTSPAQRALQAIHILNKYGDPNHSYADPGLGGTTTPLTTATGIYNGSAAAPGFNGYGLPSPIGLDKSLTVAWITGPFFVLATMLGYKYGNAQMRSIADTIYKNLTNQYSPQAGFVPGLLVNDGSVLIAENSSVLYRPNYKGAFYSVWKVSNALTPYPVSVAVTSAGIIGSILDIFAMPPEEYGTIPANQEATQVMLQALRVYAHYAMGIDYPNANMIP